MFCRVVTAGRRAPKGTLHLGPGAPDQGMTLVELIIAVVLISVFMTATTALVVQTTATSVDNRARIAAAGLAERELELTEAIITASPDGMASLFTPQVVVNPHVTPDLDSGDSDYAFELDGKWYRIERYTEHQVIGAGSPCEGTSAVKEFAALVKVTVTWQGMGATTRPHVATALFAPPVGGDAAAIGDRAILGVMVTGVADPVTAARANVSVKLTGPSGSVMYETTDSNGCAVFAVDPPAGGGDYVATATGSGAQRYVNLAGEAEPTGTFYTVLKGDSRNLAIENYDKAGILTVDVVNGVPGATVVELMPLSGGAGVTMTQVIDADGKARFIDLHPSSYSLKCETWGPVAVTITPGVTQNETVTL
ncbi:MAG: prepilin-type N-terminal cleavage/methylation domain-containing protein [Bifidobacteriaceae bacterium]|jgi:prepilin-type N-terminal cleavage/methylation domain-containing protein|nr:prepilin-type N-terminal cleavage/methylation domain-containing protein [Bifidobacteriaceae bacterium]